MEIIKKGSLKQALKKQKFDYLILSNDYDGETMKRFFKDNAKKIGEDYNQYNDFIIKKIN